MKLKTYHIVAGRYVMLVTDESRAKCVGQFLKRYGKRIDFRDLRTEYLAGAGYKEKHATDYTGFNHGE